MLLAASFSLALSTGLCYIDVPVDNPVPPLPRNGSPVRQAETPAEKETYAKWYEHWRKTQFTRHYYDCSVTRHPDGCVITLPPDHPVEWTHDHRHYDRSAVNIPVNGTWTWSLALVILLSKWRTVKW